MKTRELKPFETIAASGRVRVSAGRVDFAFLPACGPRGATMNMVLVDFTSIIYRRCLPCYSRVIAGIMEEFVPPGGSPIMPPAGTCPSPWRRSRPDLSHVRGGIVVMKRLAARGCRWAAAPAICWRARYKVVVMMATWQLSGADDPKSCRFSESEQLTSLSMACPRFGLLSWSPSPRPGCRFGDIADT